ncbi:MAG: cytidylate kinase family protein [Candidatus Micrarchaeota archaeon]|nr:cytidylate kinase family protein [Candidatus Micrarchaeota archaeon]MDE1849215.1 cytidylate kinase family protein [Candidatus Micrarchaeota archaeon]
MIIAISGLTGSGKTTIGEKVAKALNVRYIYTSHKQSVKEIADVVKFTRKATPAFEKSFDARIVGLANRQDCVVTTWMGPWLIKKATARVWLYASLDSRVRRKMKEVKMNYSRTKRYVLEKDRLNMKRFKKIYNVDINDHGIFDICINTERLEVRQTVNMVIALSAEKDSRKFK